ncbi:MAG: amidase [Bryobacteraceae bacterium]
MTRRSLLAGFLTQTGAPTRLHEFSIAQASALIARRKLSPVDLTRAHLDRIDRLNPRLNAFITVTPESALEQARRLESEPRPRGPLHGVPIAIKDLYDTAGVRTTAASRFFRDRVPGTTAAVVAALERAGAVVLGKLNMDEFAYNFTSETSAFGPIQNPWKRGYSPGGSSGGSAAALAAGLCMGALGSDTGGSIRLPAALCGVAGFKPGFGRLSSEGVLPLAWSLDHPGPMARTPEDCRLLAQAMGLGSSPAPPPLRKVRLGLPMEPYWRGLDEQVKSLTLAAANTLARRCAGMAEVRLPEIARANDAAAFPNAYSTVIFAEAYAYHRDRLRANPQGFHPGTRASIELGSGILAAGYIQAHRELERLRAASESLFTGADLLLMPTAPGPAFPLTGTGDLIYLRNTAPWNLYGLPAISIPCGLTDQGLPVGLQIVGRMGHDAGVLAAADAYRRETSWPALAPGN